MSSISPAPREENQEDGSMLDWEVCMTTCIEIRVDVR